MKRSVLFLIILLTSFFYTKGYSADSSLLPSSGSLHPESTVGFPGHSSHYLILAGGMPPEETPEPPPKKDSPPETRPEKDSPPKDTDKEDKESEEIIEPSEDTFETDEEAAEETETINDPLEPFNRAMFKFNDKVYYYCLKPVARGYRAVLPKKARISIRKFFSNVSTPVRLLNCALQGKGKGVVTEPTRFVINTTVGVIGLFDPAQSFFHIKKRDVDFDQTLGLYGMQPVLYINWPLVGASSLRGTLGLIGDTGFDPITYLLSPFIKIGIIAYEEVNETSLTIGEYEDLTESALDPYLAYRNAYFQYRRNKIDPQ